MGFPSGQREQTVNLSAKPSEVRILPPPPTLAESFVGDFGLILGIDSNYMTSCMKLVSFFVGSGLVSLFLTRRWEKVIKLNGLAGVAQLVELQPSKLDVASSNLVSRSK